MWRGLLLELDPTDRVERLLEGEIMRAWTLFLTIGFCIAGFFDAALAQGTKDPSNPVPTMVFPIRPRDEPTTAPPTAVRTRTFPSQPPIHVGRAWRYRVRR